LKIKEFEKLMLSKKNICGEVHCDVPNSCNILIKIDDKYYEPDLKIDEWRGEDHEATRDIIITLGNEV